jgi:hypothetical protein
LSIRTGLTWLFGEDQVGLILTNEVKHVLYASFLGRGHEEIASMRVGDGALFVADRELAFPVKANKASATIMELLARPADLHLFQTYHLVYPSGTRILTLGTRSPLPLIYREIAPLIVELA